MSVTEETLRTFYDQPKELVREAYVTSIDDTAKRFISASTLLVLSTINENGFSDLSPRGGRPGFIHIPDEKIITFFDQPGNNKILTMTNLSGNEKVGLLFIVPGNKEVLRGYGRASTIHDEALIESMGGDTKKNKLVVRITIEKLFPHCGSALNMAGLWKKNSWPDPEEYNVPTLMEMAKGMAAHRQARK